MIKRIEVEYLVKINTELFLKMHRVNFELGYPMSCQLLIAG